jgi:phospholipase/lecithinase/hemolysin
MSRTSLLALAAIIATVVGQTDEQNIYGQCGGIGWTGPTTCESGTYCQDWNPYYYQCIPGTSTVSSSTTATATTTSSTIKTTSTSSHTTSTSTHTTTSSISTPTGGPWEYFITFGDSYSQSGFNISTGPYATPDNILGNPPFPGWTTTDGDNWIDYLIDVYNNSVVLSYNLAYGGATTDAYLATPYEPSVLSLIDQVTEFTTYLSPPPSFAEWQASNTLFGIWMGVNDVGNDWYNSSWTTLAPEIISVYISQVQILYDAGGRDFLFLTVPPIQYTPLVIAEGSADQADVGAAVVFYNQLLVAAVQQWAEETAGVTTYIFDTTTPFETVINDPTAYGAPNNTCYNSDGVSCIWYNNYHPGQAIHNLIAQGIAPLVGI